MVPRSRTQAKTITTAQFNYERWVSASRWFLTRWSSSWSRDEPFTVKASSTVLPTQLAHSISACSTSQITMSRQLKRLGTLNLTAPYAARDNFLYRLQTTWFNSSKWSLDKASRRSISITGWCLEATWSNSRSCPSPSSAKHSRGISNLPHSI